MQDKNKNRECIEDATPTTQRVELSLASIRLFEQSSKARLEAYALNTCTPLEHHAQDNIDAVINYIKLTVLELGFLLNDFELVQALRASAPANPPL